MGANVETNILLSAGGGDQTASEIEKGNKAIDKLAANHSKLKARFGERFSNLGLQMYGQDLLRTMGLGQQAGAVLSTLNSVVNQSLHAFAGVGGTITLVVAGIAALVAVVSKLTYEKRHLVETTKKLLEEDTKYLDELRKSIRDIEDYQRVVGKLNEVQTRYLDTLKSVAAAEAEKKNADLQSRISALNLAIEKEKQHFEQIDVLKSLIKGTATAHKDVASEVEKHNKRMRELEVELRKAEVEMNALHTTGTGTFKDLSDGAKSAADATRKMAEEETKRADAALKHSAAIAKVAYEEAKYRSDAYYEALNNMVAAQNEADKAIEADVKKVSDSIGSNIGDAFAQSAIYGKNFTEAMKASFKAMAASIISDLIRITIRWAALSAMGFPTGAGGAGFGRFLSFATGGSVMVDKPTLFLAGEGGPELARFTPMSSLGSGAASAPDRMTGGGGGGIVIGSVVTHVNGINDPDAIADKVGEKIIRRIRGAGELSFART